jgi:hypothetical protein
LPAQVFISYARLDNERPPGAEPLPGFVQFLHESLAFQLKQLGPPRPELWRDVGNIERTDQFERMLDEQVAKSDCLVVVFSLNWLASDWCRRELDTFCERWAFEGAAAVRRRILLVNKTSVDLRLRPAALAGQQGHDFFAVDHALHEGARERPYFDMGRIQDDRFVQEVRELATKLRRLAAGGDPDRTLREMRPPAASAPDRPGARTIFVARPADDMRPSYERIANELSGRGFAVVPDADIPNDADAVDFIRRALARAELSIHPIGEKRGFAPPELEPIVKLQLALAAERAGSPAPPFRRILWAPKILDGVDGERDPAAVLARFGEHLDGDKLLGEALPRFVDFLIRHLDQSAPRRAPAPLRVAAGAQIYIDHQEADIDYADELAQALEQRSLRPVLPVLQGTKAEVAAQNRKAMQNCDAVALCWGGASEVWAIATASRLEQWRRLGRREKFDSALLLGPPPGRIKERRARIKPSEIDVVLDLTGREKPSPEDLDPWLGPSPPPASG